MRSTSHASLSPKVRVPPCISHPIPQPPYDDMIAKGKDRKKPGRRCSVADGAAFSRGARCSKYLQVAGCHQFDRVPSGNGERGFCHLGSRDSILENR
jgi:hypothetical protein